MNAPKRQRTGAPITSGRGGTLQSPSKEERDPDTRFPPLDAQPHLRRERSGTRSCLSLRALLLPHPFRVCVFKPFSYSIQGAPKGSQIQGADSFDTPPFFVFDSRSRQRRMKKAVALTSESTVREPATAQPESLQRHAVSGRFEEQAL